jgi:hypothetical protein
LKGVNFMTLRLFALQKQKSLKATYFTARFSNEKMARGEVFVSNAGDYELEESLVDGVCTPQPRALYDGGNGKEWEGVGLRDLET